MKRTVVVIAAGLVLAGCSGSGGAGAGRAAERVGPVVITLQMAGGQCEVAPTDTVMVRGGGRAIWQIINQCDKPHQVTIRDFEVKAIGGSEWPFDTEATEASCTAGAGKRCEIGLTVLTLEGMLNRWKVDRPGAWVYRYAIRLDAATGDPEIVIDWPRRRG
jgi:hypothetical protein